MTGSIHLPEMRLEVISALESLSEPSLQRRWGQFEEGVNYYDDLTINLHTLYDDCMVLPNPETAAQDILHPAEVPAFQALERVLGAMINDLGNRPDRDYVSDPRWPAVMRAAQTVLRVMKDCDVGESS